MTTPSRREGGANSGGLTIRDAGDHTLVRWKGEVDETMLRAFETRLAPLRHDDRPMVLALNSPGGSIANGRQIIMLLEAIKANRPLETTVEAGAMCASMCVPIYMTGSRRTAAPRARFMFHEARVARDSAHYQKVRREMTGVMSSALYDEYEKAALRNTTDSLFGSDMNYRDVNDGWLRRMRQAVKGGKDVWLTGQQLYDQGAGIVHAID